MVNSDDESGAATNFKNKKIVMSMKVYSLSCVWAFRVITTLETTIHLNLTQSVFKVKILSVFYLCT